MNYKKPTTATLPSLFPPVTPGSEAPTDAPTQAAISLVHRWMLRHYGDPTDCSTTYMLAPTDEFGWADGESPLLMWEEGPYEWAIEVTSDNNLAANLRKIGVHIEAATSWAVGFYKN